jgi:hypothetical protein
MSSFDPGEDLGDLNFDDDMAKFLPKQKEAVASLDSGMKYVLYGGALGGGKSRFLRWYALRFLISCYIRGFRNVNLMLACEDYPSLKDRQLQKISLEFPPWLGKNYTDHKDYGRCFILNKTFGSGVICFRNLDDPSKYASAEFACILVDEITKNDYETFNFLRTRLRWVGMDDLDCKFIGATNPGGPGHAWVKQLWISKDFPREFKYPLDYSKVFDFIPSKAEDNPYLDTNYWAMLHTLPERMRKAFKDGNWDLFVGQVFTEWREAYHVIDPVTPPDGSLIYMTFDWGFGAPFSMGWWYVDPDERLIRFKEWYGWTGQPNVGIRMADSEIAEGILKREDRWEFKKRKYTVQRIAGPDCFNKRPNYGIYIRPGDPERKVKIKNFHEKLRIREDETLPMLVVTKECRHFIRTIPSLVQEENNVEDVDTDSEDHVYDEACHIVQEKSPKKKQKVGLDPQSMVA